MSRLATALCLLAGVAAATPALAQVGPASPALFQAPGPATGRATTSNLGIGIVSFDAVAQKSQIGQSAMKQLQALQTKRAAELQGMQTKLQTLRTQQQTQTAVLSDAAAATMERDISKLTRDLQFAQQEAEVEVQDLRDVLMRDLQRKVAAMVAQVAKEKGLLLVVQAETAVYIDPAVDLSDEVARRLDAQPKG